MSGWQDADTVTRMRGCLFQISSNQNLKKMKKAIVTLLAGILCSFVSMAQHQGGGEQTTPVQRAQSFVTTLSGKISLTTVQKDSITNVFTTFYTTMKSYHGEGNEQMRNTLKQSRDAKVKLILADDTKYQTYLQVLAEQHQQHQGGSHSGGGNH